MPHQNGQLDLANSNVRKWKCDFVLDPRGAKRVPKGQKWRYNFVLDPRGSQRKVSQSFFVRGRGRVDDAQ